LALLERYIPGHDAVETGVIVFMGPSVDPEEMIDSPVLTYASRTGEEEL